MWRESCPPQANRDRNTDSAKLYFRIGTTMPKQGIHPNYKATNVKCACGNTFETRSTNKGDIVLEICSACHPFFTGKQKLLDTAGRIERFKRKYAKSDSSVAAAAETK